MTENKLKLNDSKTETILIKSSRCSDIDSTLHSLTVGSAQIAFTPSARDLGFIVSANELSLNEHVTAVCRVANNQIRRIASIRHYLTEDATKKLCCALVLSRLDFLNALLSGSNQSFIDRLQIVQNNAVRLIFKVNRRAHISPLRQQLHWLPIKARIDYKLCVICYNFFVGNSPSYISDMLTVYSIGRAGNRSASDTRLLKSFKRDFNCLIFGVETHVGIQHYKNNW